MLSGGIILMYIAEIRYDFPNFFHMNFLNWARTCIEYMHPGYSDITTNWAPPNGQKSKTHYEWPNPTESQVNPPVSQYHEILHKGERVKSCKSRSEF